MPEYNVSFKMPEGSQPKYKKVGKIKDGQYGSYMSICVEDMEAVIAQARASGRVREFEGKHYFNCSMFEVDINKPTTQEHSQAKGNGFVADGLDDEIPF